MDSEGLKLGIEVIDEQTRAVWGPRDCNPCYRMHLIARDEEGVPESKLERTLTDDQENEQRDYCADPENQDFCAENELMMAGQDAPPSYFYTDQGMCEDNYVDAIMAVRQRNGAGNVNICHAGHTGKTCAFSRIS
jgi:hypothetical protein